MHITIMGAGAWGTAMALAAACHPCRHTVTLHARDAAQAQALRTQRQNARYLPGVSLPGSIDISSAPLASLLASSPNCDLWVIATPMAGLRTVLTAMADVRAPVAWLCKGLESGTGLMPHEVQAQVAPHLQAGALSGPSFALEVARQQPTALVAASAHASVRDALVQAVHGPALRVYANRDIVGVEVGGAVKNVLAIACGIAEGRGLGRSAHAALITRGFAEMTRMGVALGGQAETVAGLCGLGDLVLTCSSTSSRNFSLGKALGEGMSAAEALADKRTVAEGAHTAPVLAQLAEIGRASCRERV
jgi:glycerol-3-phosphate dehydrogenase (NAD(P)+)